MAGLRRDGDAYEGCAVVAAANLAVPAVILHGVRVTIVGVVVLRFQS